MKPAGGGGQDLAAGAQFRRNEDDAMDQVHSELTAWIGRTETVSDVIYATPYAALSATLDRPPVRPAAGTPLPPLWHWLYFLPLHAQSEIGPDGHAKRGGFLPPVPLPRRMWAGSQFEFRRALRVGDSVTRTSTIESIAAKMGRTGPLAFVRVRHEIRISEESDVALLEFHDIVYREAAVPGATPPLPTPAPRDALWVREVIPDDLLLFRYSALTFNGHRIHYDRRYATEVEGYPGLVVHGPLVATLLLDLLFRQHPTEQVARFEFKAIRPTFDVSRFRVCGTPAEGGRSVHLWAQDHDGCLTMDATATLSRGDDSKISRGRQP
jgi:3-methylfumaryl-CoA hydratase